MTMISNGQMKFLPKCLLREPLTPEQQQNLGDEEKRLYNMHKAKHQVVIKNKLKCRDQINFSLSEARRLRIGKFYEEEEDNSPVIDENDDNLTENKKTVTRYILRNDDFTENLNLHDFEKAAMEIIKPVDYMSVKNNGDEIPKHIKAELDLPINMGKQDIDFTTVRLKDCELNRKTPFWSGQDVLEESLNIEQSLWVVNFFNTLRVWPKGVYGFIKKTRALLKMGVKSALFDNIMLLSVLLNTMVMSMERYGMS